MNQKYETSLFIFILLYIKLASELLIVAWGDCHLRRSSPTWYNLSSRITSPVFIFYKFSGDLEFFRGVKSYLSYPYSSHPFIRTHWKFSKIALHKFLKKEILLSEKIKNFGKIGLHKFSKKKIYFFKKMKLPKRKPVSKHPVYK